jgi:tRNA(Ile)-lysidine synthase
VHELARRVLDYVSRQNLLKPGDRVGVAVSGGPDSVALLRLLLELRKELGLVLSVAHLNHRLRGAESDADEAFVVELARKYRLQVHAQSTDVSGHAAQEGVSIETAARDLRQAFFRRLLGATEGGRPVVDKIATGHTLDDQAETVLMRLMRGTGMRGLGAIHPEIVVGSAGQQTSGAIVRPVLRARRRELEQYLKDLNQPWCEDATNRELKFVRNRVRHKLIPLLEAEFNPAVCEGLGELADIARAEEQYWEKEASGWMGTVVRWPGLDSPPKASGDMPQAAAKPGSSSDGECLRQQSGASFNNVYLSRTWLLAEPLAVRRRVLKKVGDHAGLGFEYKHIEEILQFAAAEETSVGKQLPLPAGWKLVRRKDALIFQAPDFRAQVAAAEYEYRLDIPGAIDVMEIGVRLEATQVATGTISEAHNPEQLLDASLLAKTLTVRNWRAGDRFWPAHTKSPKKVKDLLPEHHVSREQRKLWPVVLSGNEIVWIPGLPGAAKYWARTGESAVLLRQVPIRGPNR